MNHEVSEARRFTYKFKPEDGIEIAIHVLAETRDEADVKMKAWAQFMVDSFPE